MGSTTFDDILIRIGCGRYHIKSTVFAFLLTTCMAVHVLSSIFIAYPPPYKCATNSQNAVEKKCNVSWLDIQAKNGKFKHDKCVMYHIEEEKFNCSNANDTAALQSILKKKRCDTFEYDLKKVVNSSITADFNLVCDRSIYNYLLQSVFMVGVFFNGLVFGKASDRIGRRPVVMIMGGSTVVVGLVLAAAGSLEVYIVFRTLLGFTCFVGPMSYVLAGESTPSKYRHLVVLIATLGYSTGTMLIALFAYFFRYWRSLEIVISAFSIFIFIIGWIFEESPRWLISRGRYKEAIINIRKIAKFNKCDKECMMAINKFEKNLAELKTNDDSSTKNVDSKTEQEAMLHSTTTIEENTKTYAINVGMFDTMKTKNLRMQTLVLTCAWFSTSCAFYGLTLNVANIGGDVFINTMVMGITGYPATALAIYICKKIGRRVVVSSAFIFAGVFCLLMYFVPDDMVWLQITFFMIGRVGTIIPFETLFLYTIELYPTPMRSTAVGYGSSIARIGAVVSPAIALMEKLHATVPYITFGVLTLTSGVLILLLPETRKSPLLETLQETENFIGNNPGPLKSCFTFSSDKPSKNKNGIQI